MVPLILMAPTSTTRELATTTFVRMCVKLQSLPAGAANPPPCSSKSGRTGARSPQPINSPSVSPQTEPSVATSTTGGPDDRPGSCALPLEGARHQLLRAWRARSRLEAELLIEDGQGRVEPVEAIAQLIVGDDEWRRRVQQRQPDEAVDAILKQRALERGGGGVRLSFSMETPCGESCPVLALIFHRQHLRRAKAFGTQFCSMFVPIVLL